MKPQAVLLCALLLQAQALGSSAAGRLALLQDSAPAPTGGGQAGEPAGAGMAASAAAALGAVAGAAGSAVDGPQLANASNPADRASGAAVKLYVQHVEPNWSQPWSRMPAAPSSSSGVMIHGPSGERWVLTNAHYVEYAAQIQVKRRWDDRRFLAHTLAVGRDCDLALLAVDDPACWAGAEFASFGTLPSPRDAVTVVGYPIGGDTISATAGIVSRLEVVPYSFSQRKLLALQIDASINPGNSGGPVFNDQGEVAGIAFQAITQAQAENIGYAVPTPIISHFLEDVRKNGNFTGFPELGVLWQRMESETLRAASGLGEGEGGVLVRRIYPLGSCAGAVQEGDVLQRFEGIAIAQDGTVPFRSQERISLEFPVAQLFVSGNATVDVLRDGEPRTLQIELKEPQPLVPFHLEGRDPTYLLAGGLLFEALSVPYLFSEFGPDFPSKAPVTLIEKLLFGWKNSSDEEVVVLNRVLASEATVGYTDFSAIQSSNTQLLRFNSRPVVSLAQLAAAMDAALEGGEEFLRFEVEHDEVLVLEAEQMANGTAQAMAIHAIPAPMSPDLLHSLGSGGE